MRIILFVGKGGVGKTTTAAATACKLAQLGYNTLILSTDAAHSLSDAFDTQLSSEVVKLNKNLYAQEVDVYAELRANWEHVQEFIKEVAAHSGLDNVLIDEFSIFPGMEEFFSLVRIKSHYDEKKYDAIIVDCAPTAGTMQLLNLPDIATWYISKIFPIQRRVSKIIRPIVRSITDLPIPPSDEVFSSVKALYDIVGQLKALFTDKKLTSVRLVINPEKMVIKEAERLYTYLNLSSILTEAVVVNRLLYGEENASDFFKNWQILHKKYLDYIENSFQPLPILKVKLFKEEMIGINKLLKFAEELYKDKDPIEFFYKKTPIEVKKEDQKYILSVDLPFIDKKDINLWIKGEELIIRIANYKKSIFLPYSLLGMNIKGAQFKNDNLQIEFIKP